jgi:hypothetical protein
MTAMTEMAMTTAARRTNVATAGRSNVTAAARGSVAAAWSGVATAATAMMEDARIGRSRGEEHGNGQSDWCTQTN